MLILTTSLISVKLHYMISASDVKKGIVLKTDNTLYTVVNFQRVQPGKGGAFVKMKLKNLTTGFNIEKTYRVEEKLEDVRIENRKAQFLYKADNLYTFMDTENYEQYTLSESDIGDTKLYLKEQMQIEIEFYENKPIAVFTPIFVELAVTKTEPGMKGDTVSSTMKPATLQSGATILVPLFINIGDVIKVDTRDNSYVERL